MKICYHTNSTVPMSIVPDVLAWVKSSCCRGHRPQILINLRSMLFTSTPPPSVKAFTLATEIEFFKTIFVAINL